MPKPKNPDETKRGDRVEPPIERTERSSPGSGEDEDEGPADLQPDDVGDDTAR